MNQIDLRSFLTDSAALPKSTTLVRENGLRTLLLHLKDGEGLPEHHTKGAITVECLKGKVTFLAGEEKVELAPGLLISLAPGKPHSLTAGEDSLLLVTISEQIVE